MQPTIMALVIKGFKTATRSLPGMGIVLLASLIWAGAWSMLLSGTNFPRDTFQEVSSTPENLFPSPAPMDQDLIIEDDLPGEEAALDESAEEQFAKLQDWLGRAWFPVAILLVIGFLTSVWLTGGQLGYLNSQLKGSTSLRAFINAGTTKFFPLLKTMLLISVLVTSSLFLLGIAVLLGRLIGGPGGFGVFLMNFVQIAGVIAVVWIGIRLIFALIAVVVDGISTLEALRLSWQIVHGSWLHTCGLLGVWLFASIILGAIFGLVVWLIGQVLGGGAAASMRGILETVANVFLGFSLNASLISWYHHLRGLNGGVES